jgi:hypothetical protein
MNLTYIGAMREHAGQRFTAMKHRVGLRARTDFRVVAIHGGFVSYCRGIEISPSGIIVDRGRDLEHQPFLMSLEMLLPERVFPLHALARPIWMRGSQQAFKFVRISDVDRLTLAEHLDLMNLGGAPLC